MTSRRNFLTTIAGGAIGAVIPAGMRALDRQAGTQTQQAARRQVSIGGRRVRVVDVHAHCVIPVTDVVAGTPLAGSGGGGGNNALGPQRLRIMDQQGVDIQALSINGYWWYAAERDLAGKIVAAQNDGLAKWVQANSDRFVAFASVSLQHPDLAASQLDHAVKQLGLRGASIGCHVNGEDLSLPKYDPFWAKAAELGVPVFTHPGGAENIVKEGAFRGRGDLGNIIGNPLETTYMLSRLIFDGTFDKFPRLRIFASHAGGYLPSYLGRTEAACTVRTSANCANTKKPSEYFRSQILIDTMIFSEEGLRHLVAEMGVSQVVYGTDVPFNWPVTVDLVLNASFLSNAEKEAILGGTLARILKIS